MTSNAVRCCIVSLLCAFVLPAAAQESGRLLSTTGVTEVEGAGGGGLVPWALITGYGTRDAVGANIHVTYVPVSDFSVLAPGANVGFYDRLELSYARVSLDTQSAGGRLGLGDGYKLDLDVFSAKLRLFGDIVYDQDTLLPEVSAGVQVKSSDRKALVLALGARRAQGVDYYVAATKLFLAQSVLLNVTLRATEANQFGLLGFGGDRDGGYGVQAEGSVAYLLTRKLAFGAEIRMKPDNLKFAREGNAYDVFAAYFLSKNASATAGFASLGPVARQGGQPGFYLSLQVGF